MNTRPGRLHHVELWVPDLSRAVAEWGWLLTSLGYEQFQDWEAGRSWTLDGTYLVVEQSPAMTAPGHDRLLASTDGYELELVADDAEEASS